MSATTIYELIGYVGSALVVISLAMSSIIRLRLVNLAGAVVFTAYGARTLLVSDVDPRQRSSFAAMGFTDGEHGAMVLETRHG